MSILDLELAFGQVLNLSAGDIFITLVLALLLGLVVAFTYRYSVPGRLLSTPLMSSLVLLAVISAMVMMVIGNNVARAFSLVGALAIIRFRTRLRSPWDITFIFLSLAVGIASGVLAYRVAVLGTLVVVLAVMALQVIPLGPAGTMHLLRCDLAAYQATEAEVLQVFRRHLKRWWLAEVRSLRFGETMSYRYRVILLDDTGYDALLRELADVEGVERLVLDAEDEGVGQTE